MAENLPPIPDGYSLVDPTLPPIPNGYSLVTPGKPAPKPDPIYGNGPLATMNDFTTGVGESIPFKNEMFAGIAAPFEAIGHKVMAGDWAPPNWNDISSAYEGEKAHLAGIDAAANARSPTATTLGSVAGMALLGPEAGGGSALDLAGVNAAKEAAAVNAAESPAGRFARMWAAAKAGTGSALKGAAGGGAYGGAMGASNALDQGADWGDVGSNALQGAEWGAGTGLVAAPLAATGGAIIDKGVTPALRTLRNAAKQAGVNISGFIKRDEPVMAGSTLPNRGFTPQELQLVQQAGYPATNAHLGANTVANSARAAADASTEAQNILLNGEGGQPGLLNTQQTQLPRYERMIDQFLPDEGALASRQAAKEAGQNEVRPMYQDAFKKPDAQEMWDSGYENLAQSPTVQKAIKGAMTTSADEAALDGEDRLLPKFTTQDGRFTLSPDSEVAPNLQFWDHVKKNLDDIITDNTDSITKATKYPGVLAQKAKRQLLGMTDNDVPEYADAREAAQKYLGEDNAYDAGTKLYSKANGPALNVDATRQQVAGWTPEERQAAGYAFLDAAKQDLYSKARSPNAGTVDLSVNFLKSDKAQQIGQMLLGKDTMNQLNTHNAIERVMANRYNTITGQSKTNRFQQAMSLLMPMAGGAAGDQYLEGGDLTDLTNLGHMSTAALAGLALRGGHAGLNSYLQKTLAPEIARGLMARDESAYLPAVRQIATDPKASGWLQLLSRAGIGRAAQYGAQQ